MAATSAVLFYLRFARWIKMPPIFACWHKCLGHWRMKTLSLNYLLNLIHIKSLRFSIQKLKTPMLNTNLLISICNLLN